MSWIDGDDDGNDDDDALCAGSERTLPALLCGRNTLITDGSAAAEVAAAEAEEKAVVPRSLAKSEAPCTA